jgi:methionyl-tRNA formyltransferase
MASSMKVLLLSPYAQMLHNALDVCGDKSCEPDHGFFPQVDFIVCFGYREIIREPTIRLYEDRIINIHISFLPWNRGADPNFWSWFDDTPKGVTIHRVDEGIDTGNIIVQQQVTKWHSGETLRSSWYYLMAHAKKLFQDNWINIRRDGLPTRKADHVGSFHKAADKDQWFNQLASGWETPVKEVRKMGRAYRKVTDKKEDRNSRPRKYRQQAFKQF